MKISGVSIRVEGMNVGEGEGICEVFITNEKPYINTCFHLPASLVGNLSTGMCSLELTQLIPQAAPDKVVSKG